MNFRLNVYHYPDVYSKIECPSKEDVQAAMVEIALGNGASIDLFRGENHMFLNRCKEKWHVSYSGITDDRFINAVLKDQNQLEDKEITVTIQGQRVDYPVNQFVNDEVTLMVAVNFLDYGTLLVTENYYWYFIDELPLTEFK